MIDFTQYAPCAVEMRLRGTIDTSDIEKLETLLDPYLPDEGAVSAVIDFTEADADANDVLISDASNLDRLLSQFDKFARIAVVTKGRTKESIVCAVDTLMPAGSLQRFEPDSTSKARAFAAHLQTPGVTPAE